MPNLLKDIEAVEVSLVDKPAINRQFLLVKRMTSDDIEADNKIASKTISAPNWKQKIKALFGAETDESSDVIDIKAFESLYQKLSEAEIAVKAVIDELTSKKDEGGPSEMEEKEIRALVADEIKKALEPTEDQTKAAEDLKTADADFKTKTTEALVGIKTSLDALDALKIEEKISGIEGRIGALEEAKPDKKSLDIDTKVEDKKSEKDEASFKGTLFR